MCTRNTASRNHPPKSERGSASSARANEGNAARSYSRAARIGRIGRMNELLSVKQRFVLQRWKLFDDTHDRILMNMINLYDTESYAFEEMAYNELTEHIKRVDKEIAMLRISLENNTALHKEKDDTNDSDDE